MASNTNADLEQTMRTLELKKSTCEKENELVKTAQQMNEYETPVGETIYNERKTERKEVTEKDADKILLRRSCPDEQIKRLRLMFGLVEDMLNSPDFDADLKSELSKALPNFQIALQTAKRDLLRNDCRIVVTGETSAGKTTLINQLVKKKVFATNILAATGRITRIRNSESLKIKCYSKDEKLKTEEDVQDEKKFKSTIKRLTKITNDLKGIHYVDVYLPVSILKGNVIIVDTPGIGETDTLDNILQEFLPNAVAFIFVVNANNAGGIHEDKLLKILEALENKKDEMPCFDPQDALFLTNQWDAIRNNPASSDEDDDTHMQTRKHIHTKLLNGWPLMISTNIFHTSLQQVEDGMENYFTDEYKKFEMVLKETIEKNKNKRVVLYHRFLKDFIGHAARGIFARLKFLEMSESDNFQSIVQTNAEIQDLEQKCKKSKKELECYKTEVISTLAEKLYEYLQSPDGMERILNPPGKNKICDSQWASLSVEVRSRLQFGIQRWCQEKEVKSIIGDADEKIRSHVNEVESKLKEIEIEMTGLDLSVDNLIFSDRTVLGILMLPFALVSTLLFSIVLFSLYVVNKWFVDADDRRQQAKEIYEDCLKKIPLSKLKESFTNSFGLQYSKIIDGIFDKSLPDVIKSLRKTNSQLQNGHKSIKQKKDSFFMLREEIKKIQLANENFEMNC